MRASRRVGRLSKAAALLAAGAVGGGAAWAVASVPGSSGVISACVAVTTDAAGTTVPYQESNQLLQPAGNLELIDTGAGQTCTALGTYAATTLTWNQAGVQGPQGPTGPTGPRGPPGAAGTGTSVTVNGGGTLTTGPLSVGGTGSLGTLTFTLAPGAVLQTATLDVASGATLNAATIDYYLPPPASGVGGGGHLAGAVELGSSHGAIYFRFVSIAIGSAVSTSAHSMSSSGPKLIRFTKPIDKATLALFKATRKDFQTAEIIEGVPGRSSHLQFDLTKVLLPAVQDSYVTGNLAETVELAYGGLTASSQPGSVSSTSVWKNSP